VFDQGGTLDRRHRRLESAENSAEKQAGRLARPTPFGENGRMGKKTAKDKGNGGGTIALNKRARHEYHLEQTFEAGLALQGWELKAIRAGRANITEAYAVIRDGEIFLFGAQMTPLISASTHVVADAHRTRKLLLHKREIELLIGRVQREGYTLVPTALYWKGNKVKAEVALAKGKQTHDKREASKERDWNREKQRLLRRHNKDA
jgi:SsrA-binding protein